jgi:hypothetical protein
VLGRLPERPAGFDAQAWATHPDPAVRREAFRILLRAPEAREATITAAVADRDERVVRLALGAAMNACPAAAARILMERANDPALSPDLRALGVRVLASHRSPEVLHWLVQRVEGKKGLLFKRGLASKSPEMLAALTGLAAAWTQDPNAAAVLQAAQKSSDPEIVAAATRRAGGAA